MLSSVERSNQHPKSTSVKSVASLGILMLDTNFPRILGDAGNPQSWPFPVRYKIVKGASVQKVVQQNAAGLIDTFVAAGQELIAGGVDGIATTCGFLALHQCELARRLTVPVASSSLMQVATVQATLAPDKKVGIITISAAALTPEHLRAANAPTNSPIVGMEQSLEFGPAILNDATELDIKQCERDMLTAGKALVKQNPEVAAIVLECTNMVPYATSLQQSLGVPVYSIYSFLSWFQSGLMPRQFERK